MGKLLHKEINEQFNKIKKKNNLKKNKGKREKLKLQSQLTK